MITPKEQGSQRGATGARIRARTIFNRRIHSYIMTILIAFFLGRSSVSYDKEAARFLCSSMITSRSESPFLEKRETHEIRKDRKTSFATSLTQQNGVTASTIAITKDSQQPVFANALSHQHSSYNMKTKAAVLTPVNCSVVDDIAPINIGRMSSASASHPYLVSFSWWDKRIKDNRHYKRHPKQVLTSNQAVYRIQKLLLSLNDSSPE